MRRRRHTLHVSTFPFLAVLLCTMGSLLMLLLIIDRRAKAAARNRLLVAAAEKKEQEDQARTARKAEIEAERDKKHAEFARQKESLANEIQKVSARKNDAQKQISLSRSQSRSLEQQLHAEIAALDQLAQKRDHEQARTLEAQKQKEQTDTSLTRMATDLTNLEQTLAEMKKAKQLGAKTYSLVPYKGKRGDNRKPLYIECTEFGVIFHPDKKSLSDDRLYWADLRKEVETRIARHDAVAINASSKEPLTPYLFLLVRPSGITCYYHLQAALKGLKLDFGYEFIESDWLLDFPDNDGATKPASGIIAKSKTPEGESKEPDIKDDPITRRPVKGIRPGGVLTSMPAPGSGNSSVGGLQNPGGPEIGEFPGTFKDGSSRSPNKSGHLAGGIGGGQRQPGRTGTPGESGGFSPSGPSVTGGSPGSSFAIDSPRNTLAQPKAFGTGQASADGPPSIAEKSGPSGARFASTGSSGMAGSPANSSGGGSIATSNAGNEIKAPGGGDPTKRTEELENSSRPGGDTQSGSFKPSAIPGYTPYSNRGSGAVRDGEGNAGSNLGSGNQGESGPSTDDPGNTSKSVSRIRSRSGDDIEEGGGSSSALPPILEKGQAEKKPEKRLPRLAGNRDWVIPVVCSKDGVFLPSANVRFSRADLAADSHKKQDLIAAITKLIDKRQAALRPGEPLFRPQLRFIVEADGLRSYHVVYPLVEKLNLPMARQDVPPPVTSEPPPYGDN